MPNPKSGTLVTTDLRKAIVEAKSGTLLEYRTRETEPIVDVRIGSLETLSTTQNLDNVKFFVREILKQKSRNSAASTAATSTEGGSGRLNAIGGISMLPNIEKLNKLLRVKAETTAKPGSKTGAGLFIKSAYLQLGDGPRIDLDPERILPSSPAYYR
jgi:hypothetical protein